MCRTEAAQKLRATLTPGAARPLLQESSEYETDSEEDEAYGRQMLKPQFVPKAEREVRVQPVVWNPE